MSAITPTVTAVQGKLFVSSLDIAEKFGKSHDQVLKAIRRIMAECPNDFNAVNFDAVDYTDAKGEIRPMFSLTRDAFSLVAMGFTGKEALAWKVRYIEAFNAMEKSLLPTAQKAIQKTASKRERKPKAKALPPYDSAQAKIEALLSKVSFYIREVRDIDSKVSEIMTADYKSRHEYVPMDFTNPTQNRHHNAACATAALWASLDFILKAVESAVRVRLEHDI